MEKSLHFFFKNDKQNLVEEKIHMFKLMGNCASCVVFDFLITQKFYIFFLSILNLDCAFNVPLSPAMRH